MGNKNGKYHGYSISSKLRSNIIYKYDILRKGDKIHDYLNQRIAIIFLKFSSKQEMLKTSKKLNDLLLPKII